MVERFGISNGDRVVVFAVSSGEFSLTGVFAGSGAKQFGLDGRVVTFGRFATGAGVHGFRGVVFGPFETSEGVEVMAGSRNGKSVCRKFVSTFFVGIILVAMSAVPILYVTVGRAGFGNGCGMYQIVAGRGKNYVFKFGSAFFVRKVLVAVSAVIIFNVTGSRIRSVDGVVMSHIVAGSFDNYGSKFGFAVFVGKILIALCAVPICGVTGFRTGSGNGFDGFSHRVAESGSDYCGSKFLVAVCVGEVLVAVSAVPILNGTAGRAGCCGRIVMSHIVAGCGDNYRSKFGSAVCVRKVLVASRAVIICGVTGGRAGCGNGCDGFFHRMTESGSNCCGSKFGGAFCIGEVLVAVSAAPVLNGTVGRAGSCGRFVMSHSVTGSFDNYGSKFGSAEFVSKVLVARRAVIICGITGGRAGCRNGCNGTFHRMTESRDSEYLYGFYGITGFGHDVRRFISYAAVFGTSGGRYAIGILNVHRDIKNAFFSGYGIVVGRPSMFTHIYRVRNVVFYVFRPDKTFEFIIVIESFGMYDTLFRGESLAVVFDGSGIDIFAGVIAIGFRSVGFAYRSFEICRNVFGIVFAGERERSRGSVVCPSPCFLPIVTGSRDSLCRKSGLGFAEFVFEILIATVAVIISCVTVSRTSGGGSGNVSHIVAESVDNNGLEFGAAIFICKVLFATIAIPIFDVTGGQAGGGNGFGMSHIVTESGDIYLGIEIEFGSTVCVFEILTALCAVIMCVVTGFGTLSFGCINVDHAAVVKSRIYRIGKFVFAVFVGEVFLATVAVIIFKITVSQAGCGNGFGISHIVTESGKNYVFLAFRMIAVGVGIRSGYRAHTFCGTSGLRIILRTAS